MENLRYMTDYHSLFDTKLYLETFWKVPVEGNEDKTEIPFLLKEHHEFWSSLKCSANGDSSDGFKVLEFGGGPALANLISAAKVARSVTFAEYTESNRNAVNSWINDEPNAHNWSSMISYVLKHLENDYNHDALSIRTQEMRRKIRPVVSCDITKQPSVSGAPYDVVSTSFCIEECSSSVAEYKTNIGKLCEVLKPRGYLHMAGNLKESFYVVGKHAFRVFPLEEEIVLEAVRDAEMDVMNFEIKEMECQVDASNRRAVFSITARKK